MMIHYHHMLLDHIVVGVLRMTTTMSLIIVSFTRLVDLPLA